MFAYDPLQTVIAWSVNVVNKQLNLALVAKRIAQQNISCTSMVVTVFGDAVSQHGGWIWLGSLIKTLSLMGYSERLVRTAVFRLVQQDWLQASKIGRRSYYCFTDLAKGEYEKAARRIYAPSYPDWDGTWTLVSTVMVPEDKLDLFRKSLLWQGYNTLITGLLAHPSSDRTSLSETLQEQSLVSKVLIFSATAEDSVSQTLLKQIANDKWKLNELQVMYQQFLDFYRPLVRILKKQSLDSRLSFILRSSLIHEYRRILLRDPDFPEEMLPSGWVGIEAQQLTKRLYADLAASSVKYIQGQLENAQGSLSAPVAGFYKRYGGLIGA